MNKEGTDGVLSRGYRLGKLGFSLMGSYLGYQAQNLLLGEQEQPQRRERMQQKTSRRLREELGSLKGPAMKLGQMLSMQTTLLPEGVLEELAQLQMQAPAMHASLARAQFKSSLGKYPEEVFREFDANPFAAASLGQVHRAITWKGEKVAVKIQYPAIRQAIEQDFKLLRSATLPGQLTGHLPTALLDELQRGVSEETDYLREADNLEFFRNGLSGFPYLTIPRAYRELSTDRVLTMSYVEGESLSEFLKRKPSHQLRNLVGERLVELYAMQLQQLKALQADQHPGNYLFQPDGCLGMVDFGCVKRLSVDIPELVRSLERRAWRESEEEARRFLSVYLGPGVTGAHARKVLPLLEKRMDLLCPQGIDIIIRPADPKFQARFNENNKQFCKEILQKKLINPEVAFWVRADMGVFALEQQLGAMVNYSEILRRVRATTNSKV